MINMDFKASIDVFDKIEAEALEMADTNLQCNCETVSTKI